MANCRIPGILCSTTAPAIDTGTLNLWQTPVPGPICLVPAPRNWHLESRSDGFVASTLALSPDAVSLLQAIEVLRLKPYDDKSGDEVKKWIRGATIGYGHLIDEVEWGKYEKGVDKARADALFQSDITPFELAVGTAIRVGLQQYQYDALVILAFNIGAPAFKGSLVATIINSPIEARRDNALEAAWKEWNKYRGNVIPGLVNRRAAEWKIYANAVYARW